MINHAQSLAAFGWQIFPAPVGTKKSHVKARDGQARWGATSEVATLAGYWQQWPSANIGVACGPVSGVWCLDIDTTDGHDHDGHASLRALLDQHGPLPHTVASVSPSGSMHFYFRWPIEGEPIRNSAGRVAPGIDVRGEGGMVIAPPSVKLDGQAYQWKTGCDPWSVAVAPAPEWLLSAVRAAAARATPAMPRPAGTGNLAEIRELLTHIDPDADGYDGWFSIVAGIHETTGGSEDGLALADEWSQRSAKYDPAELADKYASGLRAGSGGYNIGTIAAAAQRAGANLAEIGQRHRLLGMQAVLGSYRPAGMTDSPTRPLLPAPSAVSAPDDCPVMPAPDASSATFDPVTTLIDIVQPDPHRLVTQIVEEAAKLSRTDLTRLVHGLRGYGVGTILRDAVKEHRASDAIARGAEQAAGNASEFGPYFIVENEFGQPMAFDSRGGMQPQSRTAFRDAKAHIPPVISMGPSGSPISRPASDVWWEDPATPRYSVTGYDPKAPLEYTDTVGRKVRNVYSTGLPPAGPTPHPSNVEAFLHIIRSNFPDPGDQHILLSWLSHAIREPGRLIRWAPVMQGTQGCGKGLIARAVEYAHGPENVAHPTTEIVARDFNGYMHRKTLVVVNEIGDHGKKELAVLAEKFKPWITDSPIHIEGKGRDGYDAPNFCNWIFTTNHRASMLAYHGERRYAHFISVLQDEPSALAALPLSWIEQYNAWWDAGGAEAVRCYLHHYATDALPSRAPRTTSTVQAVSASEPELVSLIRESVATGEVGFRNGWVSRNAVVQAAEAEGLRVPGPRYLTQYIAQAGFTMSHRVRTSAAESVRFPLSQDRTRLYYDPNTVGALDVTEISAKYDAAQAPAGPENAIKIIPMPNR